jgi:hypothetical protein
VTPLSRARAPIRARFFVFGASFFLLVRCGGKASSVDDTTTMVIDASSSSPQMDSGGATKDAPADEVLSPPMRDSAPAAADADSQPVVDSGGANVPRLYLCSPSTETTCDLSIQKCCCAQGGCSCFAITENVVSLSCHDCDGPEDCAGQDVCCGNHCTPADACSDRWTCHVPTDCPSSAPFCCKLPYGSVSSELISGKCYESAMPDPSQPLLTCSGG